MKSLLWILLLAVGCGVAAGLTREYIFNKTYYTWDQAQSACRESYRDLATITTMDENNRVLQTASGSIDSWVGLQAISSSGWVWTWSDGEPLSFVNWRIYWDTYNYKYICGALSFQGLWEKYYCSDSRSFYCYRYLILVQEMKTWDEAQEYCRTYYTGLASVTSQTSLRQLNLETAQTQTQSVWVGLRFMNGIWFWVSGEQLGNLVSLSSCPAPSHRCGSLNNATNILKNRNCNERLNFVCYLS